MPHPSVSSRRTLSVSGARPRAPLGLAALLPWWLACVTGTDSPAPAPADQQQHALAGRAALAPLPRPHLMKMFDARLRAGQFTPDGRVLVSRPDAGEGGDEALGPNWTVQVLVPSRLTAGRGGVPLVERALPGPVVTVAGLVPDDAVRQGTHFGVALDPAIGPRPVRVPTVAACAEPIPTSGYGEFECYRLIVHSHFVALSGGKALRTGRAVVVVRAFDADTGQRRSAPQIAQARFVAWGGFPSTFRPITAAGDPLNGFEMTTTGDARVLVFDSFDGKGHYFSFNPDPRNAVDDWTPPQPLSALVRERDRRFCLLPGAALASCPAGQVTTFGERYPVARAPITMPDGGVVPPGEPFLCLYPWIDFEGANIFCGMISPRDELSMFGLDTGNVVRLIDGPFNASPANTDCGADPDAVLRSGGRCPGNTRANGLGRNDGMWSFLGDEPRRGLPFFQAERATLLLLKIADGYAVYDEASAADFDPDNLLYLHMTPTLRWQRGLRDGKNTQEVLVDRSPDTSGHFHTLQLATPGKAQLLDGYFATVRGTASAQLTVPPGRTGKRLPDGWVGSSLFFRAGGLAEVTSRAGDTELEQERRTFSLAVAVMPMAGLRDRLARSGAPALPLLSKGQAWSAALLPDGRAQVQLRLSSGLVRLNHAGRAR